MQSLCYTAVRSITVSAGDVIFNEGELCKGLAVAAKGALRYHHRTRYASETIVDVSRGQWISEASLWVHWLHRGHLLSTQVTDTRSSEFISYRNRSVRLSVFHTAAVPQL